MMKTENTRFSKRLEDLLWWILRLFPLVLFVCAVYGYYRNGGSGLWNEFQSFMVGFSWLNTTSNPVYTVLFSALGPDGLLPLFASNNPLLLYCSYLIVIEILRVFVQVFACMLRFCSRMIERIM